MRSRIVPLLFLAAAALIVVRGTGAVEAAVAHPAVSTALVALYFALRAAVTVAFAVFTWRRDDPHRRARRPAAIVACLVAMGTAVVYTAPSASTPLAFVVIGDLVAVAGCVWALYAVLALGRCFGVLPEARGLVTDGPYALVRHPLYLGENSACAGLALAAPSVLNGCVLVVFLAAQRARMHLEENALTARFADDYRRYAAATPRLVPLSRRLTVAALGD